MRRERESNYSLGHGERTRNRNFCLDRRSLSDAALVKLMNEEVADMQLHIMSACWAYADGRVEGGVVSRCCRLMVGSGIVHECDEIAVLTVRYQQVLRAVRVPRICSRMLEGRGVVACGFIRDRASSAIIWRGREIEMEVIIGRINCYAAMPVDCRAATLGRFILNGTA